MSSPEEASRQDFGRVTREKRLVLARGRKLVGLRQSHMKEKACPHPRKLAGRTPAVSRKRIDVFSPEEASRRDSGRVTRKKKECPHLRKQVGRTPAESRDRKVMSSPEEVSRRDTGKDARKKMLVLAR